MPISTVANIAKEVVLKELSLIKSCLLQLSFSSCYNFFFCFLQLPILLRMKSNSNHSIGNGTNSFAKVTNSITRTCNYTVGHCYVVYTDIFVHACIHN